MHLFDTWLLTKQGRSLPKESLFDIGNSPPPALTEPLLTAGGSSRHPPRVDRDLAHRKPGKLLPCTGLRSHCSGPMVACS